MDNSIYLQEIKEVRNQRGWDRENTVPVAFISTINGYHIYKRRPMVGRSFVMNCVPEPENAFDCNAVRVVAPNQDECLGHMDIEIRGPPHRQYVRDIVGLTIGHVPRRLCNIISIPMRVHKTLKHAVCIYMGEMLHDQQGPKLKVMYLLEFDQSVPLQTIADHMQIYNCVPSDDLYC